MANQPNPPNEHDQDQTKDPGGPPTEISKPIGDAIPTPVEPGLDQPLPEKGETPPADEDEDKAKREPLGGITRPPGIPPFGPAELA
ncbi:hypothetical protein [Paraburkholderia rhynchosiae]|uniref:Uncharacterized protein n=1 Tax=Paraburkholderia rhynchosiae TaxID=487049 RepID=A0ABX4VAN9_9BURK|nr:hypothetical protein [Paraburkholderia rhynchosiae]PMS32617.1 hypothetical protein C0Z16_08295 [Paraburkholderia rhynchosiae]